MEGLKKTLGIKKSSLEFDLTVYDQSSVRILYTMQTGQFGAETEKLKVRNKKKERKGKTDSEERADLQSMR